MNADILIVDDTPANLDLLGGMLAGRDYRFRVAANGRRALAAANAALPDLILLDITMPDMSGYDVCSELKSHERTAAVPVIFISALDGAFDKVRAFEVGGADYVTKPFQLEEVLARIEHQLQITRLQREMLRKNAELQETTRQLEEANRKLAEIAATDGLTGVPNRRRFDDAFFDEWCRACRNGADLSLMIIDVDYFKAYNDSYGHQQGDACLQQVANGLRSALQRHGDVLARYGGEEFVVILPGSSEADAIATAQRLRMAVEALTLPHEHSSAGKMVTVSIGVATMKPSKDAARDALLRAADDALYRAKSAGRNRVVSA